MAKVRVKIAGRDYALTCADGDENRVMELGAQLDQEASAIKSKMAFVSETNLLVMTALQMADQASSVGEDDPENNKPALKAGLEEEKVADILNEIAEEIESVAASLNTS